MPKLTVDGIEVEVPAGSTVLQACEAAGDASSGFSFVLASSIPARAPAHRPHI